MSVSGKKTTLSVDEDLEKPRQKIHCEFTSIVQYLYHQMYMIRKAHHRPATA